LKCFFVVEPVAASRPPGSHIDGFASVSSIQYSHHFQKLLSLRDCTGADLMSIQIATPQQEGRPWTRADTASALLTFAILYALSPPWVIAMARVLECLSTTQDLIAFAYHPLSIAREIFPQVNEFYDGYRVLLTPWLSGI
jgi:hypothetical protein